MKLKELKNGEMFTLKPIEYPNESQVYIREEYDRSTKRYICIKWSDVNAERLLKGDKEVYTEFYF